MLTPLKSQKLYFDFYEKKVIAKPFLKWAGGKTQLIQQFENFFPKELKEGEISEYVEPFLGGGAIFFYVIQNYKIQKAYLSDVNEELILLYKVVQNDVEKLIELLEALATEFLKRNEQENHNLFYSIRKNYNQNRKEINFKKYSPNWIERASQLIFLNKTCFNGLYRVNQKGGFNVPFGRYKTPKILDTENLLRTAEIFQNVEFQVSDFEKIGEKVTENSFVYFDPPYRPISQTASFTSYTKGDFNDSDQMRLASFFEELHKKDAKLMLSNSDPKNENPNDDFFEKLYSGFSIGRVLANRMINCNGSRRGQIFELLIKNY